MTKALIKFEMVRTKVSSNVFFVRRSAHIKPRNAPIIPPKLCNCGKRKSKPSNAAFAIQIEARKLKGRLNIPKSAKINMAKPRIKNAFRYWYCSDGGLSVSVFCTVQDPSLIRLMIAAQMYRINL